MSNVLINGLPAVKARISRPRVGNWVAEMVLDAADASQVPTGATATIKTNTNAAGGGLSFSGTVLRSAPYVQTVSLRVVGGSGGLVEKCSPRFYTNPTVGNVLGDAMSDAGESLSASSNSLNQPVPYWTMAAQAVSEQLSLLASAAGAGVVWRVLKDGTVFFGSDSFQATQMTEFELLEFEPLEGVQLLSSEDPIINPGESFQGRNVSVVQHLFEEDASRLRVWFES